MDVNPIYTTTGNSIHFHFCAGAMYRCSCVEERDTNPILYLPSPIPGQDVRVPAEGTQQPGTQGEQPRLPLHSL